MKGGSLTAGVVEPYAEALMSVAQSQNLIDKFGEDVRSLLSVWSDSQEFRQFIINPVIKAEDKKAVLRRVVGDQVDRSLMNFLMLLVDKRRIVFLEGILKHFQALLRKLNQTVLAEVISAVELNEAQRQSVIEKVKTISGAQQVELDTKLDPDLIGGVIIKVGSQVIDTSLRTQLRRIGVRLTSGT